MESLLEDVVISEAYFLSFAHILLVVCCLMCSRETDHG